MSERTILITGASTGIGAATARAAAEAGWRVALAARSTDKLDALVEEIGQGRAVAIACDVTDESQVEAAVARAADFGRLEAVFGNAGVGSTQPGLEAGDTGNWRQMIDINIWGLCLTLKHALPHLRPNRGHVVLTGSRAGRTAIKGSVYGATKWFVHGLYQNLDQEVREWGGRCTLISPGMVDTPFFDSPKPDALKPEDIARAVVYALEQPDHVTVGEVFVTPR